MMMMMMMEEFPRIEKHQESKKIQPLESLKRFIDAGHEGTLSKTRCCQLEKILSKLGTTSRDDGDEDGGNGEFEFECFFEAVLCSAKAHGTESPLHARALGNFAMALWNRNQVTGAYVLELMVIAASISKNPITTTIECDCDHLCGNEAFQAVIRQMKSIADELKLDRVQILSEEEEEEEEGGGDEVKSKKVDEERKCRKVKLTAEPMEGSELLGMTSEIFANVMNLLLNVKFAETEIKVDWMPAAAKIVAMTVIEIPDGCQRGGIITINNVEIHGNRTIQTTDKGKRDSKPMPPQFSQFKQKESKGVSNGKEKNVRAMLEEGKLDKRTVIVDSALQTNKSESSPHVPFNFVTS